MMEDIIKNIIAIGPVWAALIATTFTWLLTASGAALVFLFKDMSRKMLDGMLGFTGGVMVAASFWSLLAPAIEMSPGEGFCQGISCCFWFLFRCDFLIWLR
jgi:ZIP family zinc transporter